MKEVYLITTVGCLACKIMHTILKECKIDNNFELKVFDHKDVPEFISVNLLLTDYPLVVFVKDNVIKDSFVGTKTKDYVNKLINNL